MPRTKPKYPTPSKPEKPEVVVPLSEKYVLKLPEAAVYTSHSEYFLRLAYYAGRLRSVRKKPLAFRRITLEKFMDEQENPETRFERLVK